MKSNKFQTCTALLYEFKSDVYAELCDAKYWPMYMAFTE